MLASMEAADAAVGLNAPLGSFAMVFSVYAIRVVALQGAAPQRWEAHAEAAMRPLHVVEVGHCARIASVSHVTRTRTGCVSVARFKQLNAVLTSA